MIRLQRITTADTDLYSYMEKLMTQSFPSEEYRELEELRKYTDTKTHFYNNIISIGHDEHRQVVVSCFIGRLLVGLFP